MTVPFQYKEIGRIFLLNNYYAARDPAAQVSKIKSDAEIYGADAVIIVREIKNESSFFSTW